MIATKKLIQGDYSYQASALSFVTLLTLVPLLSVIVSITTFFPIFNRFIDLTRYYIVTNFIPESSQVIEFYLASFVQQATRLPLMSIIFLFVTTIMMMLTIQTTLNNIWKSSAYKKNYYNWIFYWVVLLFSPVIIGLSIFLAAYLFSLSWIKNFSFGFSGALLFFAPIIMNTFIFGLLYVAIPRYHVAWKDGLSGGLIAALLFEITRIGFSIYIKNLANYTLIYGALAIIPLFLVWIYIAWIIILYGAVVAHTLRFHKIK